GGLADRIAIKSRPGNACQRVVVRLDADDLAQGGWVAIELTLEPGVAGNRDRTGALGGVVGFSDGSAQKCRHAQGGEVAAGNKVDMGGLVSCARNRGLGLKLSAVDRGDPGKRGVFLPKIAEKRTGKQSRTPVGNREGAALRLAIPEQKKFPGILYRQRAEQDGIQQREDGRVGANAQSQRHDGDEGEARASQKLADREAEIL